VHTTIKYLRLGLIFAFAQVFIFGQCNREPKPCPGGGGYAFLATAKWSPQQETYRVADTLFLTSSIPKILTDQINTSMVVDYSNSVGIGGNLTLYEMDTVARQLKDAAVKFEVTVGLGSVANNPDKPQRIKDFSFIEQSTIYHLQLKIIPKQKGLFVFFISNLGSSGIRGKNCSNANFDNTISNGNKNINLFIYAMGRPPASEFELDRMYCFRVL
jgi:hypothetical protein